MNRVSHLSRPFARREVLKAAAAVLLVTVVYGAGFRGFGLAWTDALGASTAHVLPGTLVAGAGWWLQRHVQELKPTLTAVAHIGLMVISGLFWLALTTLITWFFRPELIATAIPAATPGTLMSGAAIYLLVAVMRASIENRRRTSERDAALLREELAQLRARIEPHFLFNTLETISALVRGRPGDAEDAIARLGRMLRLLVEQEVDPDSAGRVSLAEEMRLVEDYLAIAHLRLGDRLRVFKNIQPEALNFAVPPFSLQTLVENAVQHGIGPCAEGGTISISATREETALVLVVSDDGVGAEEHTISDAGRGVGLVRASLAAHFPGRSTIDIASSPGLGASVRLSMPAEAIE